MSFSDSTSSNLIDFNTELPPSSASAGEPQYVNANVQSDRVVPSSTAAAALPGSSARQQRPSGAGSSSAGHRDPFDMSKRAIPLS